MQILTCSNWCCLEKHTVYMLAFLMSCSNEVSPRHLNIPTVLEPRNAKSANKDHDVFHRPIFRFRYCQVSSLLQTAGCGFSHDKILDWLVDLINIRFLLHIQFLPKFGIVQISTTASSHSF